MKLNLYDGQLNRIAIIGGQFISCLWSEGYNTVQSFTLELQATADYKAKVKPDCYLGRDDRKTLMVIKTVQITNGHIVASGKQAVRCLDDVAFIGTIEAGAGVAQAIKAAYDSGEGYEGICFADPDLTVTCDCQISNKSMLELCQTMCQETDTGFRAVREGDQISIQFYRPERNPNLVFAERFGNLKLDSITLSTENLKTHAIVLGDGEGSDRTRVDVGGASCAVGEAVVGMATVGSGRNRSLIIDARDITREEAETEESYCARLEARGYEKLLEHQRTWECVFSPLASEFGSHFDLGDILTVLLPDYGLRLQARLTRFTQKAQNNKTTTTVEVGTITITR